MKAQISRILAKESSKPSRIGLKDEGSGRLLMLVGFSRKEDQSTANMHWIFQIAYNGAYKERTI